MILSVVIVNYNVKHFLSQCLNALDNSLDGIDAEFIIVDNNSEDNSQAYIESCASKDFRYILNDKNHGFSYAMNQGIKLAKGKFVLILNPDTLVGSDAIRNSLHYLETHGRCGAVGVRMIDGQGNYLKESKRSVPTMWSSISKISGFSRFFPKSKFFSNYNLGHLNELDNHQVEVLTGAFLLTRKTILNKIGGFDETYFMYGEDIDLSLQILNQGFYNYYIGQVSIVHFKGESTPRRGLNYHYNFFHSMLLFVRKNLSRNFLFIGFLKIALLVLGALKFLKTNLKKIFSPLLRFGLYSMIVWCVSQIWAKFYFGESDYYLHSNHQYLIFIYGGIWTISYYTLKDRSMEIYNAFKGILTGMLVILILYGLASLEWRTSRAVIILSAATILAIEFIIGFITFRRRHGYWSLKEKAPQGILVGMSADTEVHFNFLKSNSSVQYLGYVSEEESTENHFLGNIGDLDQLLAQHKVHVLTFITDALEIDKIMKVMVHFGSGLKYLMFSTSSNVLLDSPDKNSRGAYTIVELKWKINTSKNRLLKRGLDVSLSVLFMLITPLVIWIIERKKGWIPNIKRTFLGQCSWVGYNSQDETLENLPSIRPGILEIKAVNRAVHLQNSFYAREYNIWKDLKIIFGSFSKLGSKA
ncbi:MAG: glycosyltransferase family 2 protein [Bacteroidia bacterium]|nr:glycosyltransferase family 2 protein [Bacteroidia bacterium]